MSEIPPRETSAGVIHAVRWSEIFPWLLLFRAARTALLLRVIVLAWVGVVATQWGWNAIDWATGVGDARPARMLAASTNDADSMLDVESQGSIQTTLEFGSAQWWDAFTARHIDGPQAGPLVQGWGWLTQSALQPWSSRKPSALSDGVLCCLWAIAVWSLIGGAIARIAALYLTRLEKIGPWAALRHGFQYWRTTAGAPLIALLGVFVVWCPLALGGLVMRQSVLAIAGGAVWFLALLCGAVLFVLILGAAVGWPLLWAGAAVERSDAFDAVSRCYAYILQRPFHLIGMVVFASLLAVVCQLAATFTAQGVVHATEAAVAVGLGEARSELLLHPNDSLDVANAGALDAIAVRIINFWRASVVGLAQAFPMAFLWPAATGAYLLLRQSVDSTELDQISLETAEDSLLPPLSTDPETDVPQMVRDEAQTMSQNVRDASASSSDEPSEAP